MRHIYILVIFISCDQNIIPKPEAFLNLEYPTPKYKYIDKYCESVFEINQDAIIKINNKNCINQIHYPLQKATIYLSYLKIKNNLDSILQDMNRMPLKHVRQQSDINQKEFFNERNQIYGSIFSIKGNAASQVQFYLTDKKKKFLNRFFIFLFKTKL